MDITFEADGKTLPAALALPEGDQRSPGVLVIHEILGLNDDIRRITRRFAASGYAALAPDLFHGLGPQPICVARTVAQFRRGGGRALRSLLDAKRHLGSLPDVDEERIGVAGFCMGGGFALLLGRRSNVGAAAAFYGEVPERAADLRGVCPVVAGYGGRDRMYGKKGHLLERHLSFLGVPHDVKTYPNAGHSYMSELGGWRGWIGRRLPLRAEHHEGAAEDSWRRMLEFFEQHL